MTALENQIQADILAGHILDILDAYKKFKNHDTPQESLFYVSLIIQEDEETKPWLCTKTSGF